MLNFSLSTDYGWLNGVELGFVERKNNDRDTGSAEQDQVAPMC